MLKTKPLTVVALLGTLAAGCGGSSGPAAGTGSTGAAAGASPTGSSCATEAAAAATEAKAPPSLQMPSESFDIKKLQGKQIWVVNALPIPELTHIADGVVDAGKAAGLQVKVVNTVGTVASWNQSVSQAVSQGAGGIVLLAVPWQVVGDPLSKAAAKKIPVVQFSDGTTPPPSSVQGHVQFDLELGGKYMADWVLADSGCDANVASLGADTGKAAGSNPSTGFAKEYKALCPACKLQESSASFATLATQLPGATQSMLRRDPKINYVVAGFDSLVTFIAPSVKPTGSTVKIVGHDGAEANLKAMAAGKGAQEADVALPPPGFQGWLVLDQLGRAMAGAPATGPIDVAQRLIDKTNIKPTVDELFPEHVGYQDKFKALWGIG